MRRARSTTVAAALAVVALGITGCGAAEEITEKAIEAGTGGDVEITEDGVEFSDDQGNEIAIGSSADIPDNWPEDVPTPVGSIVSVTSAGGNFGMVVTVDGPPQEVFDSLSAEFTSNGWTEQSVTDVAGQLGGVFVKDERSAVLSLLNDGDNQSALTLAVTS